MARVKELQIEVLDLYETEELSPEEIAPIVGMPVDYVQMVIDSYFEQLEHYDAELHRINY